MIRPEDVTFKTVDAVMTDAKTGEKKLTMDVVELRYPDGKVVAYPIDMVSPEDGRTYGEIYGDKYKAFKSGQPDQDQAARLNAEIADRQEQLKGLKRRPQGNDRVQEKLGYGGKTGKRAKADRAGKAAKGIDQPLAIKRSAKKKA